MNIEIIDYAKTAIMQAIGNARDELFQREKGRTMNLLTRG